MVQTLELNPEDIRELNEVVSSRLENSHQDSLRKYGEAGEELWRSWLPSSFLGTVVQAVQHLTENSGVFNPAAFKESYENQTTEFLSQAILENVTEFLANQGWQDWQREIGTK